MRVVLDLCVFGDCMDLRREQKHSLKVREQQEAELERIEVTTEAKAAKCQSPVVWQKEAEAMAAKC